MIERSIVIERSIAVLIVGAILWTSPLTVWRWRWPWQALMAAIVIAWFAWGQQYFGLL